MSSPPASQSSSIPQRLRATKRVVQDVDSDVKIATTLEKAELDALEQDAFKILGSIRPRRNMVVPINKIPPEILALIPDFFHPCDRDQCLIALTHVCRAWREVFISRSSLWVDFYCWDAEKTRVYLERSRSSPINLSLRRVDDNIPPCDPLFQVLPHAVGRLKTLYIEAPSENVHIIASHLSHSTPLLEDLMIDCACVFEKDCHVLASTLFDGDLSSLRELHLECVRTELPWRNMVNLTSFTLAHTPLVRTSKDGVSVGQFLDFFEGAPHLSEVTLLNTTPTTGAQNGRLVSLVCLKRMYIEGDNLSSVLLDHLLIPAGGRLITWANLHNSLIGEHLPRFLDNLENLSDFTTIQLYLGRRDDVCMKLSGPNGEVNTHPTTSRIDWAFESLARLDTSKAERLEVNYSYSPFGDSLLQALLPMKNLRTLTLSGCKYTHTFIHALCPGQSPSKVMACPKLEEFVLVLEADREESEIRSVIEMAAARAARGMKLRTIRIVDGRGKVDLDVPELREHIWNVENSPLVGGL